MTRQIKWKRANVWCKNGSYIVHTQGRCKYTTVVFVFVLVKLLYILTLVPEQKQQPNDYTRCLKKVFVSIKGIYFQCNIQV